ncbi:HAD family hydrolase [Neogemmobacter tilapiae]|uniref:Haloacid dehalogenase n=1 Tax=Neogemmobacter tilapiae TaxID=875041 RepID=A0A918TPF1_9RHOB|nr:HAD family phosphatase [Gemmobacter tilapiae]GHC50990.1 haloacid dehalogenase [Gemmobacter tilapiae]
MTGLVIFDFDGVIANSEIIALAELQAMLAEHGLKLDRGQMIDRFLGNSLDRIVGILAAETGRPVAADFRARWYDRLFARYEVELQPVAGISEVLDALEDRGTDYCIASGSSRLRLSVSMGCIGMADRFKDRAFSAEDVRCGKPEPDLMLYAAAMRGAMVPDCLVVEDATAGVLSARRAGMRALGFVGGEHLAPVRDGQAQALRAAGAFDVVADHAQTLERLAA